MGTLEGGEAKGWKSGDWMHQGEQNELGRSNQDAVKPITGLRLRKRGKVSRQKVGGGPSNSKDDY